MSIQHRLATPVIQPRMRFFDTDGKPLVGGKVYAFKVGTEEFKPTYRNSELTALNTNPVILDGTGSALIYLRGANLLKIYDRYGNFIEERIEYQQRERAQFYDDYGRPLKNGYVYTYDYQSTIRKTSYSIDDVINPNPIVLDENGTALVNIVGAYRLRQYNSKNVFVGDQDFKRPPIKALTSVVYPLYFQTNIQTHVAAIGGKLKLIINKSDISDTISTTLSITSAVMYAAKNTFEFIEDVTTLLKLDSAVLTQKAAANVAENISTSLQIKSSTLNKMVVRNSVPEEKIKTSISIASAKLEEI